MIEIRWAVAEDDADLLAVDKASWTGESGFPSMQERTSFFTERAVPEDLLVAEYDGKVVGYLRLKVKYSVPEGDGVFGSSGSQWSRRSAGWASPRLFSTKPRPKYAAVAAASSSSTCSAPISRRSVCTNATATRSSAGAGPSSSSTAHSSTISAWRNASGEGALAVHGEPGGLVVERGGGARCTLRSRS